MKLHIIVVDGVGGVGKTTFINELKEAIVKRNGVQPVLLKFPLGTDESIHAKSMVQAVKENLQRKTEQTPLNTGVDMIREQAETIGKTIKTYQEQGSQSLILLVDRAFVSTCVYQGIDPCFAQGLYHEILLQQAPDYSPYSNMEVLVLTDDPDPIVCRKIQRITKEDPNKLKDWSFTMGLINKTKNDLNRFEEVVKIFQRDTIVNVSTPRTCDVNAWIGVLVERIAEKLKEEA